MPGEADLITVAEASIRTGNTVQHITGLLRRGKIAGPSPPMHLAALT